MGARVVWREGRTEDEGQGWAWAVEFALAHLPKTVFQVFDDECCILSLSYEIKMGPNFINLSCAFLKEIFTECVLLSSSGCSLVCSVWKRT